MADQLSPADRASLAAERGSVNMTVGGALIFERGPGTTQAAVMERLASRMHLIPRYRQRIEESPLGLAQPVWVDDPGFDIAWHVRAAALPDPAGDEELAAFVARELSRRLDRDRPLWEMHVIENLSDDRAAIVPKMHHALVDGIAAVDIGTVILDPGPEPMEIPAPEEEWRARPYDRRKHLARLAATPFLSAQRVMMDSAGRALSTSARSAAEDLKKATDLLTQLAKTRPSAPMTPFNEGLSPNRDFAFTSAPLDRLKAVGKSGGGTVNDALLAAVAGMLQIYLDEAGLRLERDPVALVPVSVRREDERGETGNRISTVLVDLPVDEPDPLARIRGIAAEMGEIKDSAAVRAGAILAGATGWAPPLVSSVMVRGLGGVRAFNLVVSNVPGPQQPFYLNGQRMLEVYPAVPLNPGNQGLTVGILSYDGGVYFGLLGDRMLKPGLDSIRRALDESLEELLAAAPG
jgi:diacylglycerol O-acyltransferase / wax synthase